MNRYYMWLVSLVCDKEYDSKYYSKLLHQLFEIRYTWFVPLDENREADGLYLRNDYDGQVDRDWCSVLEMMVALAVRIEHDYLAEDSANVIFWGMIKSLGLYFNDDYHYDSDLTDACIEAMLKRTYRKDGKGGLFTIKHPRGDVREIQIWQQAMWYVAELD